MTEADLDQLRAQHPLIGKRLGGPQQPVSAADVAPGRAGTTSETFRTPEEEGGQEGRPWPETPAQYGGGPTAAIPAAGGSLVWVLDELWASRAKKMAAAMNKTPEAFLESLVHRAWTSAPLAVRYREL
jgi:hypothetical protein